MPLSLVSLGETRTVRTRARLTGIDSDRLPLLPRLRGHLFDVHDLQGRTQVRSQGSHGLSVDLFARRERLGHGHQGGSAQLVATT
jgi:hypothetical protein